MSNDSISHSLETVDDCEPTTPSIDNAYVGIRNEMKQMSFGELMELQDKLGMKVFNEIYRGVDACEPTKSEPKPCQMLYLEKKSNRGLVAGAKEIPSKDAPKETSSKQPTSRFRNVIAAVSKKKVCDPRFDDSCGDYSDKVFRTNYAFLKDIRERDRKKLEKRLARESNEERRVQISAVLHKMKREDKKTATRLKSEARLAAIKTTEKEMVKRGKTPYFLKNSERKNMELVDQYEELSKSGKLENYLKSKRKKNVQKHRKIFK